MSTIRQKIQIEAAPLTVPASEEIPLAARSTPCRMRTEPDIAARYLNQRLDRSIGGDRSDA